MDFPHEVSSPTVLSPPLSGVLSRQNVDLLVGPQIFRRYGGVMVTTTQVGGKSDVSNKPISYALGVRSAAAPLRGVWTAGTDQVDQRFSLDPAARTEIAGILRKYSNFGNDVETADLAAIVQLLAAACAKYSATGSLTCAEIRRGAPIQVGAISVQDRVTTQRGSVFIPRHSALIDVPGLFEAYAAAANGSGARVVTDVLAVDPLNNAPRLLEPEGAELAHACWTGLRGLLHLYDTSGYGAIAALAATKGFHGVLTVVGHTDEGAVMRNVLRKGRYAVPYGCILVSGMEAYVGLPTYRRVGNASQQCAVDAICLMTAAATAVCDPTVDVDGRAYPTVYTSYHGAQEEGGSSNAGTDEDALSNAAQIASSSAPFADNYVKELARLFMVNGGETEASRGLCSFFSMLAGNVDRHLRHRAVAPYYWVEPTTLYRTLPDTDATKAGYGPMCGTDVEKRMPTAEKASFHGNHYFHQYVDMQWRSARTTGWAVHMLGNRQGGLANARFRQADPEMFAFRGAGPAPNTREAIRDGETLDQYLWGHGNCMVPAPSECLYVGRRVRLMNTVAIEGEGLEFAPTHTFNQLDLASQKGMDVVCRAVRPAALRPGGFMDDRREVRCARAAAEMALEKARSTFHIGAGADVVFSNYAFTEPSAPAAVEEGTHAPTAVAQAPEMVEEVLAPAVRRQGPAAAHVMLQQALRARVRVGGEAPGPAAPAVAMEGEQADIALGPIDEGAGPAPPAAGVEDGLDVANGDN